MADRQVYTQASVIYETGEDEVYFLGLEYDHDQADAPAPTLDPGQLVLMVS